MNELTDTRAEAKAPFAVASEAAPGADPGVASQAANDAQIPYPPAYQSLMVVGMLGSVYGRHDEADLISTVIEQTLPDPLNYRINRALAQGMGGHAKVAVEMLQSHLDANPQDDAAKVVLAVSMMMSGDERWQTLLENVLASSSDPNAREAAMGVIGYLFSIKQP